MFELNEEDEEEERLIRHIASLDHLSIDSSPTNKTEEKKKEKKRKSLQKMPQVEVTAPMNDLQSAPPTPIDLKSPMPECRLTVGKVGIQLVRQINTQWIYEQFRDANIRSPILSASSVRFLSLILILD